MNETDQQLLQQLRDLHLPESVSWWPLAPGWWIVVTALLFIAVVVSMRLVRNYLRRRQQTPELRQLNELYKQCAADGDATSYYDRLTSILKQSAIERDDSMSVPRLSGNAWVDWMEQSAETSFTATARDTLTTGCYQRHAPLPEQRVHEELCRWISRIDGASKRARRGRPHLRQTAGSHHA